MPELAVVIRIAPSTSSTTTNGINHHFFSWRENARNSLNKAHMDEFNLASPSARARPNTIGEGKTSNAERRTPNFECENARPPIFLSAFSVRCFGHLHNTTSMLQSLRVEVIVL